MEAIIKLDVPDWQIGQEVAVYFKDTMRTTGICEKNNVWIPVSERLPEDGTYLVTVKRMDGNLRIDMKSFAKDLHKVDEFDFPKHKCGWYDYDSEYGYLEDTRVIAWMPLLKPYALEESEDKE